MVRIERSGDKGWFFIKFDRDDIPLWKRGQYFILRYGENYTGLPLFPFEREGYVTFAVHSEDGVNIKDGEDIKCVEGPCGKPLDLSEYRRILFVSNEKGVPAFLNIASESADLLIVGSTELADTIGLNYLHINSLDELEDKVEFEMYDLVLSAGDNDLSRMLTEINKISRHIACVDTPIRDGTGLCLICRVYVKGEMRLNCVDGRWFRAKDVDWHRLRHSEGEKVECLRR